MGKALRIGLVLSGILIWVIAGVAAEAPASQHTIEVAGSDYLGAGEVVEGTYAVVKGDLQAFETADTGTRVIKLPAVTGMSSVTLSPHPFEFDDLAREITITGTATVLSLQADVTLRAVWPDDTSESPEMTFDVAFADLQLSSINATWTFSNGIDPGFDAVTITFDSDGTTFSGDVVVQDMLGHDVTAALGLAEDATITVAGTFSLDWGLLNGDFADTAFELSASFPVVGSGLFPSFIQAPTIGVTVGFDAGDLSISLETSLTLEFASEVVNVDVSGTVSSGPALELTGSVSWPEAFGVDWLNLEGSMAMGFGPEGAFVSFSSSFITGVAIEVTVEVSIDGSLRLEVSLDNDITLGEILETLGLNGLDSVPDFILGLGASDVTVSVTVDTTGSFVFSGLAEFGVKLSDEAGAPEFGAKLYFSLDNHGNGLTPTVGIRLNTDKEILLSDIVGVPVDPDMDFPVVGEFAQLGAVFSTATWSNSSVNEDSATREFFAPLYGADPGEAFTIEVVGGFGVIADLSLPKRPEGDTTSPAKLGDLLARLGMEVGVHVEGELPLFDPTAPTSLTLELSLEPDLPKEIDYIEKATLSLELAADPTAGSFSIALGGTVDFRLPAGMPAEIADGLQALGVPVTSAAAVSVDPNADPANLPACDNGTVPRWGWQIQLSGNPSDWYGWYCYDVLSMGVAGTFEASTGGLTVSFEGSLMSLNGGDNPDPSIGAAPWNPLGLQWIGLSQIILQVSVGVGPDGMPGVELGFLGSAEVGDPADPISGSVAGKFGVTALPAPPFVKPSFDGFRFRTDSGVELQDLVDVVNIFIEPFDPNATIPDLGSDTFPNIALLNVDLSLGLADTPSLCIPQGLIVAGELFINPADGLTGNPPQCIDGELVPSRDAQEASCLDRKDEGCFASVNFELSNTGVKALGSIAGFDLGLIEFDDAAIDLAIALDDLHFKVFGGVDVYNLDITKPDLQGDDVLASGDLALSIGVDAFDLYGRLEVLGFSTLVDGNFDIGILKAQPPSMSLHVLLAATEMRAGNPDWEAEIRKLADPVLEVTADLVLLVDGITTDLLNGKPGVLENLPARLSAAGVPVPGWLGSFISAIGSVADDAAEAGAWVVDVVLNGLDFTIPGTYGTVRPGQRTCYVWPGYIVEGKVVNGRCYTTSIKIFGKTYGVKPYGVWKNPTCWASWFFKIPGTVQGGTCWAIPPIPIDLPGQCDWIFPESTFPEVRQDENGNDLGRCTVGGVIRGAVEPLIEVALEVALPGDQDVDLDAMKARLLDGIRGDAALLDFTCAEFDLELGSEAQSVGMALDMEMLGVPIAFGFEFDFAHPVASTEALVLGTLFPGTYPTETCEGLNEELFEPLTLPDPNPVNPSAPQLVLDQPATAGEGTAVTITGSLQGTFSGSKSVTLQWGDGDSSSASVSGDFSVTHTYVEDGSYTVEATCAGCGSASKQVTIVNEPPTVGLALGAPTVDESDPTGVELTITIADPGSVDTHTVAIEWGDGARTTLDPAAATASHTYVDDDPTATPSDVYTIDVTVLDDDGGAGEASTTVEVVNVAPGTVEVLRPDGTAIADVDEGTVEALRVNFTDQGSRDDHAVYVNGGSPVGVPEGGRQLDVWALYLDDDPDATLSVKVTDDDGGELEEELGIVVRNVSPQDLNLIFDPIEDDEGELIGGSSVIAEGDVAELLISFTDPGILDTHEVVVEWGDGTPSDVVALQADAGKAVSLTHVYADDNPTATPFDGYTISVTVTDDDGGVASGDVNITVANVLPMPWAGTDQRVFEDEPIVLDPATLHDQGTLDTHTATIDWGDGTPLDVGIITETPFGPPGSIEGADGTIAGGHVYPDPGIYTVTVCVADDDEPSLPICDTFEATVVHGFLRMALFGGADPDEPKKGKVTTDHDTSVGGWIGATGDVRLHDASSVTESVISVTGGVHISKYSVVGGDVIVRTKAELKKWVSVYGAVHAVEEAKIDDSATVDGGVFTATHAIPFPEVTWFSAGVTDQPKDKLTVKEESASLPPGEYGKVEVKHGSLTLQSGTYRFHQLKTSKSQLLVDLDPDGDGVAVPLVVLVTEKIDLDGGIEITSDVGDPSDVIFVAGGNIDLRKEATYLGTFLTDVGNIDVHKDAIVDGALYGRHVKLKDRVDVTYRPAIDTFVELYVPVIDGLGPPVL